MMSTSPESPFIQIFMVSPSGYWGANRSILQAGKKNTAINAPDANATSILEVMLSLLFMILLLTTSGALSPRKKIHK
jgi:hypothetical protein